MSGNIDARIATLSPPRAGKVMEALAVRLRDRAQSRYEEDPDTARALAGLMRPGAAEAMLAQATAAAIGEEPDPRATLAAFAAMPEFADDVANALDRGMLANLTGFEPWLISAAVAYAFSISFKLKANRRNGKTDWSFEAGRNASPASAIGMLLRQAGRMLP